ncbi:MBL fold metallo-hydrolase [Breznakiellaceae bacterium SP9]
MNNYNERIEIEQLVVGALATNCWIYPLPDLPQACIVIDPGADGEEIIKRLEQRNYFPRYILLTHGHFDHLAALPLVAAHFASRNIEIAIHEADSIFMGPDALAQQQNSFVIAAGNTAYIDAHWQPLPTPTILLKEGSSIGPLTCLHVPGHSLGSMAFLDAAQNILFSGDTLFKSGYGRTDLPGGNARELGKSLERLLAMDETLLVLPGHGGTTTIGKERRYYR